MALRVYFKLVWLLKYICLPVVLLLSLDLSGILQCTCKFLYFRSKGAKKLHCVPNLHNESLSYAFCPTPALTNSFTAGKYLIHQCPQKKNCIHEKQQCLKFGMHSLRNKNRISQFPYKQATAQHTPANDQPLTIRTTVTCPLIKIYPFCFS